jgi:MFS family permease
MQHLFDFFRHSLSRAIGLVFAANGFLYGSWSALIPFIKHRFQLDDGQLGLLLFCLPLGVMTTNPVASLLIRRWGMQRITTMALIGSAIAFWAPLQIGVLGLLAIVLFVCGAMLSIMNIGMNTCASAIEHHDHRRILSTCHGMWSVGAMLGSALAGTATGLGLHAGIYMSLAASAVGIVAGLTYRQVTTVRDLPIADGEQSGKAFTWPNAALWGLIILSLCVNLTEGTMADWAAVYLRDVVKAAPWVTGYGFAAYAFFMATGRFMGDGILMHNSPGKVLQIGGGLAVLGLVAAILLPFTVTTLLGFALVGAGVSLGAPILYGASAKVPGMAPGAGLATMNTFAMFGFLSGPTLIGFLSKAFSLPIAFGTVAAVGLFWTWRAGRGLSA